MTPPKLTPLATAALQVKRRADSWNNVITGLGVDGRDKRLGADFDVTILGLNDCETLYRSDDMAARAAELLPREMTREWCEIQVEGDEDAGEQLDAEHERLETKDKFLEAQIWANVFGGSGILIGAADGKSDPLEQLDEAAIRSVDWLTVFDARELIAVQWYADPGAAKYGEPEIYRLQPLTLQGESILRVERSEKSVGVKRTAEIGLATYVHESRIIRFEGVKLTRRLMRANHGWGDTIYNRILDEIRDFQASFDAAAALIPDFAQAVINIDGLSEIIAGNQSDVFQQRMAALNQGRSVVGAYLLDSVDKENFERKASNVQGLPELLEKMALRLASTIEVPVTMLMGQSPAGLNATGDTDVRWFYSRVKSRQHSQLEPRLKRLTSLIALAKKGPLKGVVPESFSISFRPLWSLSDLEESERRANVATADAAYVNAGVVTAEEVAATRFGGDKFNGDKIQLVEVNPEKRALAAQEQAEADLEGQMQLKHGPDDQAKAEAKGAGGPA